MRTHFFIILCLSLYLASQAFAELPYAPIFTWEPTTTFADPDKTPLDPIKDLKEYRLYCEPGMAATPQIIPIEPPYEWKAPAGLFKPGKYTCYLTSVTSEAYGAKESAPSDTVTFLLDGLSPSPIVIFKVR